MQLRTRYNYVPFSFRFPKFLVLLLAVSSTCLGQEPTATPTPSTLLSGIAENSVAKCYEWCSGAIVEANWTNLERDLCKSDSNFAIKLDTCLECMGKTSKEVAEVFDDEEFINFLNSCKRRRSSQTEAALTTKISPTFGACLTLFCENSVSVWKRYSNYKEIKQPVGCSYFDYSNDIAVIDACANIEGCFNVPADVRALQSNYKSILDRSPPTEDPNLSLFNFSSPRDWQGLYLSPSLLSPYKKSAEYAIWRSGQGVISEWELIPLYITMGIGILAMTVVAIGVILIYRKKRRLEDLPYIPGPYAELCSESAPKIELPSRSNRFPTEMSALREPVEMGTGRRSPCVELEGQLYRSVS